MSKLWPSFKHPLSFAFILLATAAVGAAPRQTGLHPDGLTVEGRRAYERLLFVRAFAVGPVGYGSATAEGETALRVLLKEKGAGRALRNLVDEAGTPGALYALLGLRIKDSAAFKAKLKDFSPRERRRRGGEDPDPFSVEKVYEGEVMTVDGCIIFTMKARDVIAKIEGGAYDDALKTENRAAGSLMPDK